jgi:hypothetical protein
MLRPAFLLPPERLLIPRFGRRSLDRRRGPATGRSGAYPGGTLTRWNGAAGNTQFISHEISLNVASGRTIPDSIPYLPLRYGRPKIHLYHLSSFWGVAQTWVLWPPAGWLSKGQYDLLSNILHYAGGVMPTLVALLLLYLRGCHQMQRDYWQRLTDFKSISKAWYAVILLTVPILTTIGIVFDIVLGGKGAKPEVASSILSNPLSLFPFAIIVLMFGPLPEEMAWRTG